MSKANRKRMYDELKNKGKTIPDVLKKEFDPALVSPIKVKKSKRKHGK